MDNFNTNRMRSISPAAAVMNDVEFLWSCVRDCKLSKEAALNCDLLEKRAKIFSSDGGDGTQTKTRIKTLADAVAQLDTLPF